MSVLSKDFCYNDRNACKSSSNINEQYAVKIVMACRHFWPADVQLEAVLNPQCHVRGSVCDHRIGFIRHNCQYCSGLQRNKLFKIHVLFIFLSVSKLVHLNVFVSG